MSEDGAHYAEAALSRADRARGAGALLARRAARRALLLNGGLVAASVLTIGLVDMWLADTWVRALLAGIAVAAMIVWTLRTDRAAPARATPPLRTTLVTFAVTAVAVMVTAAVVDHYVSRFIAIVAASAVGFAGFAAAGWKVGR